MISFLLEEGVLTVGALSGIFTTGLLNSLKINIIDPTIENIYPSHNLDKIKENNLDKSKFADMFPLPIGNQTSNGSNIKWQTFLKDFITWLIIMIFFYFLWKKILQPLKANKTI